MQRPQVPSPDRPEAPLILTQIPKPGVQAFDQSLPETGRHTVHPQPVNSPARAGGETEAAQPFFPGNKATVPRIWRVLYRKHLLYVQDTHVSLVLEKLKPLFWIQCTEWHECSPAVLCPLSFSSVPPGHLHVSCACLWQSPCHGLRLHSAWQALSKPQWGYFLPYCELRSVAQGTRRSSTLFAVSLALSNRS